MKATLRVEAIGDNADGMLRVWRNLANSMVPDLGTMTFGTIPKRYWVAEITGPDPKYRWKRVFLRGKKDYRESNSVGSRGVYVWYVLESGHVYEVNEPVSWKNNDRYFCRVNDAGDIEPLDEADITQWIPKDNGSSALTSSQPPDNV